MTIKSKYIKPKFKKKTSPKVGLLALSTDLTIEKDFRYEYDLQINQKVIYGK